MKKVFLKLAVFQVYLALSASALAGNITEISSVQDVKVASVDNSSKIKNRMVSEADALGLDIGTYAHAVAQYHRVMLGDAAPDMETIDAYALNAMALAEKIVYMNTQRSTFASWLGIPVQKLDSFLRLMPDKPTKSETGQYSESSKTSVTTYGQEAKDIIVVYCRDLCGQNTLDSIDISLYIYNEAVNTGYEQYEPFPVEFVNTTGTVVGQATYKYNNFSGAWLVSGGIINCSTCQEP